MNLRLGSQKQLPSRLPCGVNADYKPIGPTENVVVLSDHIAAFAPSYLLRIGKIFADQVDSVNERFKIFTDRLQQSQMTTRLSRKQ